MSRGMSLRSPWSVGGSLWLNPRFKPTVMPRGVGQPVSLRRGLTPTKNLSINNIYRERHFSECDDRRSQMVQPEEALLQFFVAHEQFAEAIEPTVRHFHDPPSGFLAWITLFFLRFLTPSFYVRNVAVRFDDLQRRSAGIACVGAEMFAAPKRRAWTIHDHRIQGRCQLTHVMPIGSGHDER